MTGAIAVIPARGGSKRIPRKNIKDFRGRPAMGWPISVASASGLFERIIVSTEDLEIAEVAVQQGAEVPFFRPAGLADDHTGTTDVIRDAVRRLALSAEVPVCCIYPTALFLQEDDLRSGLELLQGGARWVLAMAQYPTPIDRAYRRAGGLLVPRQPEKMPLRSQDLEPAYFDVGQFYFARAATWLDESARIWEGAEGVEIPLHRAVDIDTPGDWARAERMFAALGSEG